MIGRNRIDNRLDIPNENTGIPEIVTGSEIRLGDLKIGLLLELLDLANLAIVELIGGSNIAITGLGTAGTYTNGNNRIALSREVERLRNNTLELNSIENKCIAGGDNNIGIGVTLLNLPCDIGNARSRVATTRLS